MVERLDLLCRPASAMEQSECGHPREKEGVGNHQGFYSSDQIKNKTFLRPF